MYVYCALLVMLGVCSRIFIDYIMLNVIGHPVHVVIRSELCIIVVYVCVYLCCVLCYFLPYVR